MKRSLFSVVAVIAVMGLVLSCTGKDSGQDKSLQTILDRGVLVMGLDDSFPPMGFRNENNEIVGYDVDLAKEVASRMGVELRLQPIDWNAKEQELNTGKIDCIWNGFTITPARAEMISFTKPYLKNAQVVVVKDGSSFNSLADLAGRRVGLQAGSSAAEALEGATEFRASIRSVVEFRENLTALMDLEIGGVDAVIMDLMVANDNINRSGKPYRILSETLSPEDYGIGFRKKDLALTNKVQEILEEMAADGTLARITISWFGADISVVGR